MNHDSIIPNYINLYHQAIDEFKKHHASKQPFVEINVKKEKTITKYKYQDFCKFKEIYQLACRGTMIHMLEQQEFVFHMNKFFNHHQMAKLDKFFEQQQEQLQEQKQEHELFLSIKYDGSHISVYYKNNKLHISTLGCITPMFIGSSKTTFDKKFKSMILDYEKFEQFMKDHQNLMLSIELCSYENKIITVYEKDMLKLITFIDMKTGIPFHDESLEKELEEVSGITLVEKFPIKSTSEIPDHVEKLKKTEQFGKIPEGFVCFIKQEKNVYPFMKIKLEPYMQEVTSKNQKMETHHVERYILENKIDDVEVPEQLKKHIDYFNQELKSTLELYNVTTEQAQGDIKTFALALKNNKSRFAKMMIPMFKHFKMQQIELADLKEFMIKNKIIKH